MTWKRLFTIALCTGALWLYADRSARAQGAPPQDDNLLQAHPRQDPPPGSPHAKTPTDEDFDSYSAPQDDRRGRPGPRPEDGRQPDPGMQGPPPGQHPGMMRGGQGGMPGGITPGFQGIPGGIPGYGPGMMRRQDPDLLKEAELDRQIQQLCEEYRNAPDTASTAPGPRAETREEIQKQVERLVTEQFNLRQERQQKELKRFEEQIKRLRETIEKREKAKADIISRHIKELLGQEDELKF
jgi:hypothetical protein